MEGSFDPDFGIICFCGEVAPLNTSSSQKNPGRRYFSCPKYKGCGFFCWYEPLTWTDGTCLGPMKVMKNLEVVRAVDETRRHEKSTGDETIKMQLKMEAMQREIDELQAKKEFQGRNAEKINWKIVGFAFVLWVLWYMYNPMAKGNHLALP